MIHTVGR